MTIVAIVIVDPRRTPDEGRQITLVMNYSAEGEEMLGDVMKRVVVPRHRHVAVDPQPHAVLIVGNPVVTDRHVHRHRSRENQNAGRHKVLRGRSIEWISGDNGLPTLLRPITLSMMRLPLRSSNIPGPGGSVCACMVTPDSSLPAM